MFYSVKEIFYSMQGEGARTGRPAVFCRFTGCNLWSGEARHRSRAQCTFCDTDFVGTDGVGGGKFEDYIALADQIISYWPSGKKGRPYVVFTGGEPLLQLDEPLIYLLQDKGFEVAVETNGTLPAPKGVDWLCVSPKGKTELVQSTGDELKLVYPQKDVSPGEFVDLDFGQFYLQPLEDEEGSMQIDACLQYCLEHPQWHLSLQTHKTLGIR